MNTTLSVALSTLLFSSVAVAQGAPIALEPIALEKGSRIVLMGNGLGSRMLHYGHFETGLHLRYPNHELFVRNLCDEGNTPSFRPHSGRANQLGFPGAEAFARPYCDGNLADGVGHFETDEQWLTRLKPDVLIAFFGFNESFQGGAGLANFQAELDAFVTHTLAQSYGGEAPPALVLVSPTAYEDRSDRWSVSDGKRQNANLAAYTQVMEAVAKAHGVRFLNAFNSSLTWLEESRRPLTVDGALLNDEGYRYLSTFLFVHLFDAGLPGPREAAVHAAVAEKNWFWINDFKIPNGVHVFGRRHNPFGPANYPFEIDKLREMTLIRDRAIWAAARGRTLDVAALDARTSSLPEVETNYTPSNKNGELVFLDGEEALATIKVPAGYRIEQWATEDEFPDLANPVQLSFDNKGRLWVATMPSYPHYRPGDPRPDDKLLILEDTDGDGKADKQTVFADGLHLPMGFEFAPEGVYVSQGINLVLLKDEDGDDRCDGREIILSGFDDHDTHHAIGAYCADPSGAILMCEGVFLRSNIETAHGPVRGTNGGFFRYAPQRRHLERHAQLSIPNPWGIAFDEWGQHFFLHTSGPTVEWMLPGSIRPRYGVATPGSRDLIESAHRVRPTSGIEFMSSRHFPDEVQGDMLLNNDIGFLGTKQHEVFEDGTGFGTKWRQDLTNSSDGNYRPVDIETAPDGSLYIVDWHNPLIGHMQHNARDPHRDHDHGRIYRITYPGRPLVEPAEVHGAPIATLLDNLKLPEYRTRYRTRRELRGRAAGEVLPALRRWVVALDPTDARHEHHLLEALWVTWGLDQVDEGLLRELLGAKDHRARAAAVRVLRYNGHRIAHQSELLEVMAGDPHGRVKMEVIAAASWLPEPDGLNVLAAAAHDPNAADEPPPSHVKVQGNGARIELSHPDLVGVTSFRMTVKRSDGIINLAEMVVTSGGKDVTSRAKLSQSSEYNGGQFPIGNLVDGDRNNFSHTSTEANPWVEASFESPTAVDQVTLWNRSGFEGRFSPAEVTFFAGERVLATLKVNFEGGSGPLADGWLEKPFRTAQAHLQGQSNEEVVVVEVPSFLKGKDAERYLAGAEIYARDGHCSTCHQPDGLGLQAAGFPPLADTEWATGDEDRLIRLTLNGLLGPMQVKGVDYPGLVPMTPFGALLSDEELASVLTYVRSSFGNQASVITPDKVAEVRVATQAKIGFYSPEELDGGAATTQRAFVKMWKLADFAGDLRQPLAGRDHANAEAMFSAATCNACHNIQGEGGNVGADLTGVGAKYSQTELMRHILEPSLAIADEHRLYGIILEDESRYFGLIVKRTADTIELAEEIQRPEETVVLALDEVADIVPLPNSAMPTGLLVTLSKEEVLDLLAYVIANGARDHAVFGGR